ncbi:hypothetical protein RJT34_29761 [Clitoria ternatea]|uniref:AP2/ERF domain-containing protein n=1 Tax=Clitoria ternatea TaxID=43366 RepID=A0AAN9ES43_CLITE
MVFEKSHEYSPHSINTSIISSSSSSSRMMTSPSPSSKPQPSTNISSSHKRRSGRKKFRVTRHPVYRGVRQRNGNKWVCEIREPGKKSRIWLGTYPSPEMAARAHDVAILALRGTSATFNFPDQVLLLPLANSCSAVDIRAAAAQATTSIGEHPCLVEEKSSKINMQGLEGSNLDDESKTMFLDEEALYNMPGLLDSMAEGLLITPPSMKRAIDWDSIGCEIDLTLWTHQ